MLNGNWPIVTNRYWNLIIKKINKKELSIDWEKYYDW